MSVLQRSGKSLSSYVEKDTTSTHAFITFKETSFLALIFHTVSSQSSFQVTTAQASPKMCVTYLNKYWLYPDKINKLKNTENLRKRQLHIAQSPHKAAAELT